MLATPIGGNNRGGCMFQKWCTF